MISWLNVAKTGKMITLTTLMVEEITDSMSSSMAATHFSEEVGRELGLLEYEKTADLCHDIRLWWESEDKANSRHGTIKMHVNGWPLQLWEALIAHKDANALLTYDVRAFSSLAGETSFSELTLNDKRGQGTLTTEEFG
ncbi:hypothetical protein MAR_036112, partial [Mya arenaria]